MTSRNTSRCAHGVLSLDTPDDVLSGVRAMGEPSTELLDRARVGWERFTGADEEQSDA
ncbi:hypothetical protein AB0892_27655 [Streptomyces sp. NPDC005409]|uniref:hypothetical protein n=1 Tax=Streptomyces sp. NPDC005409 TaxID=3155342 RepID=UPI00345230FF